MTSGHRLSPDGRTLTVRVPMEFKKKGGRKLIVLPEVQSLAARPKPTVEPSLVKALARAHRWARLMEDGRFSTIADLAKDERINKSYLSRVLRLTLLAPDIAEAILVGEHPANLTLSKLLAPFPIDWHSQSEHFLGI